MLAKPPSKDESLEILDFIVNVLKEHEKELDRLITELGTTTEALTKTGELGTKITRIEEEITDLEKDITRLFKSVPDPSVGTPVAAKDGVKIQPKPEESKPELAQERLPLIIRCKQWEDFLALATHAQTVAFTFEEAEKSFSVHALNNKQIITYTGEAPKIPVLFKNYLSRHLQITDRQILEGELSPR